MCAFSSSQIYQAAQKKAEGFDPAADMAVPREDFDFHSSTVHIDGLGSSLMSDEPLRQLLLPFGLCVQVTVRVRPEAEYGPNKSWALVTVKTAELAAKLLTAELYNPVMVAGEPAGLQLTMEAVDINRVRKPT